MSQQDIRGWEMWGWKADQISKSLEMLEMPWRYVERLPTLSHSRVPLLGRRHSCDVSVLSGSRSTLYGPHAGKWEAY